MTTSQIAAVLSSLSLTPISFILNGEEKEIETLVTDSRNHFDPQRALFFAIATPGGNDGHKFMRELYERGVRNFVCQYIPENFTGEGGSNIIITSDTIDSLSKIGKLHRNNAKEIVAITGSRGKTTLKELLFQLLEPSAKVSRSPRSYNSKIGVPLSLWQISPESDIAIIEAGISKKGEMVHLSGLIEPDTVIFTNIGDAHSQGFGSLEEKAQEKALLGGGESVKHVIYPLDYPPLAQALKNLPERVRKIGWSMKNPEAELFIQEWTKGLRYTWHGTSNEIEVSKEKEFDSENLASALAFMLLKGFGAEEIKKRFAQLHHIDTRLNVSEGVNGCSLILDSYTSDLSSLLPAIDFMRRRKMPWQKTTLILSDLHHEGSSVEETYRQISALIEKASIDRFIGIGKTFKSYAGLFGEKTEIFESTEEYLRDFSAGDFNREIVLLKGSAEFGFTEILQRLEAKRHETVMEVNLDALLRNFNYFRSHVTSSTGIIAMVKASGYGAGSYEIAKTLQDAGAAYLAVAALDEGVDLRSNGITMPVMIMNPRAANYRPLFKNRLEPVVYSLGMLETLAEEARHYGEGEYPVHIKLDTGMHRMGFLPDELPRLIELLKGEGKIKAASIFSHLATADCLDLDEFTLRQLQRFEEMSSYIIEGAGYPIRRHILNSAGILRFPEYHYDYVRLGIGLYGANTLPAEIEKPLSVVSTLRSVLICLRDVEEDEAVGYSRKGRIKGKRRIATVPIGYADGMNRKFGNGAAKVFLNGHLVPTIGNICMDATMLDVTGVECHEGDSVEIFGENVGLQELADTLDTIPYEILTSVSPRVKRIYFRE